MENNRKRVIALGFFDGVHLGHQALLRRAMERSRERGLTPAMVTFDRSPREFVTGLPVPLLTTAAERRRTAAALFPGMEVVVVPFDRAMMTMPWEDFVNFLQEEYRAGWLVAGHDFRFGHKNSGSAALLKERAQLLGRPFAIAGPVRHGKRIGTSQLGRPTVNLVPDSRQLVPAFGVYAARAAVGGRSYPAVTNVGVRPTVDTDGGVTVESHLLTGAPELYGAECRVEFLSMLRPERRFGSIDALREQIARDSEAALAYLEHRKP